MISIIICSVNERYRESFLTSLRETIGVEHEVICIYNNVAKLSIAEAYNRGASNAKYDVLVFIHEDVVFHTKGWGKKLLNWFAILDKPGVIGVAGSTYVPISPSGWWLPENAYLRTNYIQSSKDDLSATHAVQVNAVKESKVFLLDGFFLAIKKKSFREKLFDEELTGFHGYDLSLSLRTSIDLYNYFIPDIAIEHLSGGKPDSAWIKSLITVYDKLYSKLPYIKEKKVSKALEIRCFGFFLENLKMLSSSRFYKIRTGIKYFIKVFLKTASFRVVYLLLRFSGKLFLSK